MSSYRNWILLLLGIGCFSCEDVIDVDLDNAEPKLMIAGTVTNKLDKQEVSISRTVPFGSDQPFDPVSGATVFVVDDLGTVFPYAEEAPGRYRKMFKGYVGQQYTLQVEVDGEVFVASSTMPEPVSADSVGTGIRNILGEENKFISVKYFDPPGVANYYRYSWSVNGGPVTMVRVANDKFNDGKYVSEDVTDFDTELVTGDFVFVWMQCIDRPTFDFWNAVQSNNPGNAAPANPPSVFGERALGYFSAQAVSEFPVTVQ